MRTPLTVASLETVLDKLASIIIDYGDRGSELLPMYQKLESELSAMKEKQTLMDSIRERLKQSKSRTEAISQ